MKKLFILSMMLMAMTAVQAQVKVAPKMQKGDVKNFVTTSVTNLPGQGALTINYETVISVVESQANGFKLNMKVNNLTSDAAATNIAGQLLTASQEMMQGVTLQLVTDTDGKVQKIANYAEIKQLLDKKSDNLIDKLIKAVPQIGQMIPKETLKQQIVEGTTEEKLIQSLQGASCPLALNGKTLMTGAQEEYINEQQMKMKRMYFVNGNNITSNASLNMTKDELKAYIIQQVEKTMPDQADMIKQNIDNLMQSGMLKMDIKETATYEMQDNGWMKNIKVESSSETMGQSMKSTITVTLK